MANYNPERKLVKVERTRIEIRDDVAVRLYKDLVMEEYVANSNEFPNADRLRELSENALDAAYIFYQERFNDKRIQRENNA